MALFLELLGFVVRHRGQGHRQTVGLRLSLDGAGDTLGVAGLGAVENGQAATGAATAALVATLWTPDWERP